MAIVTDRRPLICRAHRAALLGAVAAVLGPWLSAAPARAAAPAAGAQTAELMATAGLQPSQVTAAAACPPAAPGAARCAAQTLVLRSDGALVRPSVQHLRWPASVAPGLGAGRPAPASAAGLTAGAGLTAVANDAAAAGVAPPLPGTPAYLQQAYDLTALSASAGSESTVAVVDAYNDPNAASDLATYRATYGLPACTAAGGCFRQVNESGAAAPLPAGNSGWETEISLDLDAVSAICPNCHILLVEASSIELSDLAQAQATAAALGATEINDSWAIGYSSPVSDTLTFPGIAVVASSGDSGYDGSASMPYPAALPGVTAAGGTTLTAATGTTPSARGYAEAAWSLSDGWGGGSGCATDEPKPSYQTDTGCSGRSYADVSADGDPATGLSVYDSGNGGWMLVGGTSLSSPIIAAFDGLIGVNGASPGWAYADSALLNDPTTGTTGACPPVIAYICTAGAGYDGPTGAGSISGDIVAGAPGIGGPSIGTGDDTYTTSVTATTASLAGGVYPNGLATAYWWQYGPTTAYGQATAAVQVTAPSPGATVVAGSLAGLAPGTVYHYRLVAQNADGTSYGYDTTLTTAPSPPVQTSPPVITGTARQGQTLSATPGAWSPAGSYGYQWQRLSGDGPWVAIDGATAASYVLGAADVGDQIRVVVTATNAVGSATAASTAVGPVLSGLPAAVSPPLVIGAARVGQKLAATTGVWNPTGADADQWRRSVNGGPWRAIPGATAASIELVTAELGDRIDVVVTATNAVGSAASASAATAPVRARAAKSVPSRRHRGSSRASVSSARRHRRRRRRRRR